MAQVEADLATARFRAGALRRAACLDTILRDDSIVAAMILRIKQQTQMMSSKRVQR